MRRFLFIVGFGVALLATPALAHAESPFAPYAPTVLADDPFAYYKLDDAWTFPLAAQGSTATIVDASPAQRNGLAGSAVQPQRSALLTLGQSEKAVEMVTTSYPNNQSGYRRLTSVLGGGADGIRPRSDDWSFETWWDPQSSQSAAYLWGMVFEDYSGTGATQGWGLVVGQPQAGYGSNVWDPQGWNSVTSTTRPDRLGIVTWQGVLSNTRGSLSWRIPNFSDWVTRPHHIVVTHRASNQRLQIYVDGVLRAEGNAYGCSFSQGCSVRWETPPQDPSLSDAHRWGTTAPRSTIADAPGVRGKHDEIALYKKILTADQVQAHYFSGGGASIPASQVPPLATSYHQTPTTATRADPVNTATGVYATDITDAALPGTGIPFAFNRVYSSANTASGRLGPGWTDSFTPSLAIDGSGNVTAREESGAQFAFTKNPDGSYKPAPGVSDTLTATRIYRETILNDGPLSYWRLGETSGTIASDSSGNGRTGTYSGSYTLGRSGALPGDSNAAVRFTGGHVLGSSLSTPLAGKSFSVEAWVKLSSNNGNLNTVASVGANEQRGFKLGVDLRSGGKRLWWEVGDGVSGHFHTFAPTVNTIDDGNWHHIVGVYDYATRTLTAFYDGVQLPGSLTIDANSSFDSGSLYAGTWSPSTSSFKWNGDLDEVAVYSSALASSRVLEHYQAAGRSSTTYDLVRRDQTRYRFNQDGRLLSVKDRNGQGVSLGYDGSGNLTTATDAVGRQVSFSYTDGLLTQMTLADGRHVDYGYTGGRLTSVVDMKGSATPDPNDGKTTYEYDADGRLSKTVDQNGNTVVENTYGAAGTPDAGRIVSQKDGLNRTTTFAWDPATQTSTVTDARGNEWKDVYFNNILWKQIDPLGNTTTYGYDARLNTTAVIDPNGNQETMAYDAQGNLLTHTQPAPFAAYSESWTYNGLNDPLTHTDFRGKQTSYTYDTVGNLTDVTQPGALVTHYEYDPSGNGLVTSLQNANGKTTSFGYDAEGNVTRATSPLGNKTTFGYDASGRQIWRVDPRGNVTGANPDDYKTQFAYDQLDRRTSVTDPLGNVTSFTYDAVGNRKSVTDPKQQTTAYNYDGNNRLETVTAPDQSTTTYAYDEVGNLTSRTDANLRVTSYEYDLANRLKKVTKPLGKVWTYSYDAAGNLETVVDANGNATTADPNDGKTIFDYDSLGRLSSIDYSDATPDVGFTYDGNSNRASMTDGAGTANYTYDDLNRLTQLTRGTDTFAYQYDSVGRVTKRTYPTSFVADYAYDDDGRLQAVTSGTETTSYGYDAAGNVTTTTLPAANGYVETRAYDRVGRPLEVRNAKAGTTLSVSSYEYDPAGLPTKMVTQDETVLYDYDNRDRLTRTCYPTVVVPTPVCSELTDEFIRHSYDAVGNRLTETRLTGTTSYAYDAADQLTSTSDLLGTTNYTYDTNGNQTQAGTRTFAYDLGNRMLSTTAAGTTTSYGYDGDGTRLSASSGPNPADTTNYLWDFNHEIPQIAAERDGAATDLRSYLYGLDRVSLEAGGQPHYYLRDGLGSVVNLTSPAGQTEWSYTYEPFGSARSAVQNDPAAPANPMRFTGQLLDPTGLYHLRARQYDPAIGRFTARDPFAPALTDPYVAEYIYVGNRPTVLVDPTGEFGFIGAVVGAVVGAGVYSLEVALTDKEFTARGLTAYTIGGAVAGATGGAGGALIARVGLSKAGTRAAMIGVDAVAGGAGGVVQAGICGQPITPQAVALGATAGVAGGRAGQYLSPQRGFKIRTLKGVFSGSPNSKRLWGSAYIGGLADSGAGVASDTGRNCK